MWRTNRALQKLEAIDEEKRARHLELRYCGMTAQGLDKIPFGVRALQSGIEVDGIWICQQEDQIQDISKLSSSTTLAGDSSESSKRDRWTVSTRRGKQNSTFHSHDRSSSITMDHENSPPRYPPTIDAIIASSTSKETRMEQQAPPMKYVTKDSGQRSYTPTGFIPHMSTPDSSHSPARGPTTRGDMIHRSPHGRQVVEIASNHALYTPSRILGSHHANKSHGGSPSSNLVSGLQIESLEQRSKSRRDVQQQAEPPTVAIDPDQINRIPRVAATSRQPNKLRKKPPKPQ